MKRFNADEILKSLKNVFESAGVKSNYAEIVSSSLIKASLRGVHSHGVTLVNRYIEEIDKGIIEANDKPNPHIQESNFSISVVLDKYKGFGQVGVHKSIDDILNVKNYNCNFISFTATNINHIGDIKQYASRFNAEGFTFIGIASAGPNVGLKNGRKVGTNPICITIPIEIKEGEYVGCDLATSVYPEGKVRVAQRNNITLPDGIIFDNKGNPSNTPDDLYEGGWLLPFGGYKGFALGSSIDLLLGCIGGSSNANGWEFGNNAQFFAIKSITKKNTISYSDIKEYFGEDIPGLAEVNAEEESIKLGVNIDEITANLLSLN